MNNKYWLKEVLDKAEERLAQWPEWTRKTTMEPKYKIGQVLHTEQMGECEVKGIFVNTLNPAQFIYEVTEWPSRDNEHDFLYREEDITLIPDSRI